MRWYSWTALFRLILVLASLSATQVCAANELLVSAALSLKAPFEEIGRAYERKNPGSRVVFNFAASGVLQKQIEAGAPADIFASASPKEVAALNAAGLLLAGTRYDLAGNSIVLVTAMQSPVRIASFNDLTRRDVKLISIGNPASVPAGKYAEETLKTLGLWEMLRTKMVYAEHVRQAMDYVTRGEVDAGMVFLTDAIARGGELKIIAEAPDSSHKSVVYTIAAIKGTRDETTTRDFIAFVMSKEGREILKKHGFRTGGK